MAWVTDEGLALFAGLNVTPKKSFLSEHLSRIAPVKTSQVLAAWHAAVGGEALVGDDSFNLDFHSVPHMARTPSSSGITCRPAAGVNSSLLVFLAQDAAGRAFAVPMRISARRRGGGSLPLHYLLEEASTTRVPRHPVFDSRLTYGNLARLDTMGIAFITLRRRSSQLPTAIAQLPRSAADHRAGRAHAQAPHAPRLRADGPPGRATSGKSVSWISAMSSPRFS